MSEIIMLIATLIVLIIALRKLPAKLQIAVVVIMFVSFIVLMFLVHHYPDETVRFLEQFGFRR